MAIFRSKGRRPRGGDGGSPPAATPPPSRQPTWVDQLRDRLHEIADTAAPEDALEPALRAVLDATSTQAGAVCLYDARHGVLRLAAEVGLSDEGCRRLRNVRRADPAVWDMPLHGLLNRRAYLIESAPKNRYVPRLVEHASSVRTVACVPLYSGLNPIGTVILIALAPRSLAERDIRMLERPVVELGRIIEAVRQRAGQVDEPAPPVPSPHLPPDLAAVVAERDRLRNELAARLAERARLTAELAARTTDADRLRAAAEAATEERTRLAAEIERVRRDAERVESLQAALTAAEQERARLAAGLEAAAAERAGQARAEAGLERARAEAARTAETAAAELAAARAAAAQAEAEIARLRTERARLAETLAAHEETVARERAAARTGAAEVERLTQELHAAAAREAHLREEIARAMPAAGGPRDPAADAAKAAALADAEAARAALASSQAAVEALEAEAEAAHAEVARLAAQVEELRATSAHAAAGADEARALEATAADRLAQLAAELDAVRSERDRLAATGREQHAETITLVARLESLAAERDRLRDSLAGIGAEREGLAAEASEAAAARARLEDALARETAERTRLAAALAATQTALAALETVQAEAAARSGEIERLVAERDRLIAERDGALARAAAAPPAAPPASSPPPPPEEDRAGGLRVVTVSPPARAKPRVAEGQKAIVVLDADGTWESLELDDHVVQVMAPTADLVSEVIGAAPARIVVNLTTPGALGMLAALRGAGSTARFWGCLAYPAGDRALPLGMLEPATRPLEPDSVLETLTHYTTRGTRIVTAGTDVDALMSLRQALARRGASVSMAWDAKQAIELLGVVRPEVVVVDLALPRRDGYGILGHVGRLDPLPTAIVVPGTDDMAAGFAGVLVDPVHASRTVPLARLLADVVARSEASATERRQKIRALGRK
jgi:hypothetical protein